jgi:hypothetical protein
MLDDPLLAQLLKDDVAGAGGLKPDARADCHTWGPDRAVRGGDRGRVRLNSQALRGVSSPRRASTRILRTKAWLLFPSSLFRLILIHARRYELLQRIVRQSLRLALLTAFSTRGEFRFLGGNAVVDRLLPLRPF